MKFLLYSIQGDGLALAPRLQAEGNEVQVYLEKHRRAYENMDIEKLDEFKVDEDVDVVLFDMVGRGRLADDLRSRGLTVLGSSRWSDTLELDRTYGTEIMQAVDIKVPPTYNFTSFADAQKWLADDGKGLQLFFKPHNNQDTALTFEADSVQMMQMLDHYGPKWKGSVKFELQEKVEGVELSIEGWFNGQDWILPFNSTIEDKRLYAGDLGPNTGCMSNVVFAWQHMRPKIAKETLLKLTSLLRKANYVGPVDLNTKGGYGLEFTTRFGYDAIWALTELLTVDVGKFLSDIARAQTRRMPVSRDFAFGLRMYVPRDKGDIPAVGLPIGGVKYYDPKVWLLDARRDADGDLETAGVDGIIGVITDRGSNIKQARQRVFNRVQDVKIPNMYYRVDAGERALRQINFILSEMV